MIPDRFLSTQNIAYNQSRKIWIGSFGNSSRQRWTTTESRWVNNQMISLVPREYSDKDEFMQRWIDTLVKVGLYTKGVEPSYDLGKTWDEGAFLMEYNRAE